MIGKLQPKDFALSLVLWNACDFTPTAGSVYRRYFCECGDNFQADLGMSLLFSLYITIW